jgi:hypothetical protein
MPVLNVRKCNIGNTPLLNLRRRSYSVIIIPSDIEELLLSNFGRLSLGSACLIILSVTEEILPSVFKWIFLNPLRPEVHINNIYKCSSYNTDNELNLRYKDQFVKLLVEIIDLYSGTSAKSTTTLCGKNAEFLNVRGCCVLATTLL